MICEDCEKEPYEFWEPDNFYHSGFWTYGCDCEERCGYGATQELAKMDYERVMNLCHCEGYNEDGQLICKEERGHNEKVF